MAGTVIQIQYMLDGEPLVSGHITDVHIPLKGDILDLKDKKYVVEAREWIRSVLNDRPETPFVRLYLSDLRDRGLLN